MNTRTIQISIFCVSLILFPFTVLNANKRGMCEEMIFDNHYSTYQRLKDMFASNPDLKNRAFTENLSSGNDNVCSKLFEAYSQHLSANGNQHNIYSQEEGNRRVKYCETFTSDLDLKKEIEKFMRYKNIINTCNLNMTR